MIWEYRQLRVEHILVKVYGNSDQLYTLVNSFVQLSLIRKTENETMVYGEFIDIIQFYLEKYFNELHNELREHQIKQSITEQEIEQHKLRIITLRKDLVQLGYFKQANDLENELMEQISRL